MVADFMGFLLRYIRLYTYFIQFSLTRIFEFRFNFLFRIFMDVVYAAMLICFYKILFGRTEFIAGWSETQMLVFTGACLLVDSVQMTLFSDNLNSFSEKVNRGDLDYYLVRPISALFFLTVRDVSLNSFINFLISMGIFIYYLLKLPGEYLTFLNILWFGILLINGCILYYLTRLLFVLPVFWLGATRGLDTLFYNLYYVVDRPDKIFRGPTRIMLTTVLPFCLMTSFPARVFFGEHDIGLIAQLFGVTLGLSLLVRFIWECCLRSYTSASS